MIVETPDAFEAWVAQQKAPAADAARRVAAAAGTQLFTRPGRASAATRSAASPRGGIGPDLTHVGSRAHVRARGILPEHAARTWRAWIKDPPALKPGLAHAEPSSLTDADAGAGPLPPTSLK